MNEDLFKDLVAFIYDKTDTGDVPITPDTEIEADLGITGDDGVELIVHFSKRYNVNIDNFYFNNSSVVFKARCPQVCEKINFCKR